LLALAELSQKLGSRRRVRLAKVRLRKVRLARVRLIFFNRGNYEKR